MIMDTNNDTTTPERDERPADSALSASPGSISHEVAKLEQKYHEALGMLHSVVITIARNRQEGNIMTPPDEGNERLDGIIQGWRVRLQKIQRRGVARSGARSA